MTRNRLGSGAWTAWLAAVSAAAVLAGCDDGDAVPLDGGSDDGSPGDGDGSDPDVEGGDTRTLYRLALENVSAADALVTSSGDSVPVAYAPGVVIVHTDAFAPFTPGTTASAALEQLSEDGNNRAFLDAVEGAPGVQMVTSLAVLDSVDYSENPLMPGATATVDVLASPGDRLSLVMMFGASNDVFVATPPEGVPLSGEAPDDPVDLTAELSLWDTGTEVNEEPGAGANQPSHQENPGDGVPEGGVVTELSGGVDVAGYAYPSAQETLRLTIEAP